MTFNISLQNYSGEILNKNFKMDKFLDLNISDILNKELVEILKSNFLILSIKKLENKTKNNSFEEYIINCCSKYQPDIKNRFKVEIKKIEN